MSVFLNTRFTFSISRLKIHFDKMLHSWANLKEKYADPLSPIRQAGNSLTLRQNFTLKDSKALVLYA